MSEPKDESDAKQDAKQKSLVIRLDAEHWGAVDALAKRERMSKQDFIMYLVRITHAAAFGKASPFLTVESLLRSKAG